MILNYCGPALVVAFSVLFQRERPTRAKLLSLAAALTGAILISGQAVETGLDFLGFLLNSGAGRSCTGEQILPCRNGRGSGML